MGCSHASGTELNAFGLEFSQEPREVLAQFRGEESRVLGMCGVCGAWSRSALGRSVVLQTSAGRFQCLFSNPQTGYMFGKGIYFADMVSKSANYCHTSQGDPIGLILLGEVALGNM